MRLPEIVLVAREPDLAEAWQRHCGDLPGVGVATASILDVAADAYVSPANSRGAMGGGIDLVYRNHFGRPLERRVKAAVVARHGGSLPVGSAAIVATAEPPGSGAVPWLLVAPTMPRPQRITGTDNAYRAARALLEFVAAGSFPDVVAEFGAYAATPVRDAVRRVAIPGLGTGTGGLAATECARQVRAALEAVAAR